MVTLKQDMVLTDEQVSIHNRRPVRPKLRGLDYATRRARLLAARSRYYRSPTRTAILLGVWDGGTVLAAYGMPLRLPLNTEGNASAATDPERYEEGLAQGRDNTGAAGQADPEAEGGREPARPAKTEKDA